MCNFFPISLHFFTTHSHTTRGAKLFFSLERGVFRTENGKRNRRTKQEQRVLAHYALQEGGKAHEVGLKLTDPTTLAGTSPNSGEE